VGAHRLLSKFQEIKTVSVAYLFSQPDAPDTTIMGIALPGELAPSPFDPVRRLRYHLLLAVVPQYQRWLLHLLPTDSTTRK